MEITEFDGVNGIISVEDRNIRFTVDGGLLNFDPIGMLYYCDTERWQVREFLMKDKDVVDAMIAAAKYF